MRSPWEVRIVRKKSLLWKENEGKEVLTVLSPSSCICMKNFQWFHFLKKKITEKLEVASKMYIIFLKYYATQFFFFLKKKRGDDIRHSFFLMPTRISVKISVQGYTPCYCRFFPCYRNTVWEYLGWMPRSCSECQNWHSFFNQENLIKFGTVQSVIPSPRLNYEAICGTWELVRPCAGPPMEINFILCAVK